MPEHPLAPMHKLDPEFMDQVRKTDQLVYADGALPKKFKLLIALAFDAAHGAEAGVGSLANAAIKEGATKAEIAEALRVAYFLTGVPALYTASSALRDLAG